MPSFATFDQNSLLNTMVKAKLDTRLPPIPLDNGDEFLARCTRVDIRQNTKASTGETFTGLRTTWEILDDDVRAAMNVEHPTASYDFLLDIDPKTGGLALGPAKNVRLGRLLAACGINGKEWSLGMIQDATATVKIRHRSDPDDPEILYNEVSRVAAPR